MNPTLHEPIGAAEFKASCLQIIDQVNETGAEVTITKHGHPVAKLVPIAAQVSRPPLLGSCKDSLIIRDEDLLHSTADEWIDPPVELCVGSSENLHSNRLPNRTAS